MDQLRLHQNQSVKVPKCFWWSSGLDVGVWVTLSCKLQELSALFLSKFWEKWFERWKFRNFWFSSFSEKCSSALNGGSARLGITVHGFCCCCCCCTHTKVFLVVQLFTKVRAFWDNCRNKFVCGVLHRVCLCLWTQMLVWQMTSLQGEGCWAVVRAFWSAGWLAGSQPAQSLSWFLALAASKALVKHGLLVWKIKLVQS